MLARSLVGRALRDRRGVWLGRVADVGFANGELRYCRTERGTFEVYARAGDHLIAGRRTQGEGLWLKEHPRLRDDPQGSVSDFVLGGGLAAPLCVVTRGLVHDLLRGRQLLPTSRVVVEDEHGLPGLR